MGKADSEPTAPSSNDEGESSSYDAASCIYSFIKKGCCRFRFAQRIFSFTKWPTFDDSGNSRHLCPHSEVRVSRHGERRCLLGGSYAIINEGATPEVNRRFQADIIGQSRRHCCRRRGRYVNLTMIAAQRSSKQNDFVASAEIPKTDALGEALFQPGRWLIARRYGRRGDASTISSAVLVTASAFPFRQQASAPQMRHGRPQSYGDERARSRQ